MKNFNLSEWALNHQPMVLFIIMVVGLTGIISYGKLGQAEDPPFTFKFSVVSTLWPGAATAEVDLQLTDKLERKLQEVPYVTVLRSYSRPGQSLIFVGIDDAAPASIVPETQYQIRKRISDIRQTLPPGVQGPFFNDEFGDTFGNIFALIGEGFSEADKKVYVERIRKELLRVPDVAKVEIFGEQAEKIYIDFANAKLATLGIDGTTIIEALQQQNAVVASGAFETPSDRIYVRTSGALNSVEAIQNFTLRANNRMVKISDVATVHRGAADPPSSKMRYGGIAVLGIGVSMREGGDIVTLGEHLATVKTRIEASLPVGMALKQVSDQPRAVRESIREFVQSLAEAIVIVMAVTFLSLGLRTGFIVALSIPLVLAATFFLMLLFDVGLHKISLGALILSLGLLVDDAIIAVEMMAIKMEQGWERSKAASFAYTSTAFPMLTGTVVTIAGFLPIAMAKSGTGEYTRSIFQVTTFALIVSWFAAVILIPYFGFHLLPEYHNGVAVVTPRVRRLAAWVARLPYVGHGLALRMAPSVPTMATQIIATEEQHPDVYDTPFFRRLRRVIQWCVQNRKIVMLTAIALLAISGAGFGLIQQQFFPPSTRVELLVDLKLPEGVSFAATETQVKKFEAYLDTKKERYENYVSYVGIGAPRFYFPLDQQLAANSFAQFVITANSIAERKLLRGEIIKLFEHDFLDIRTRVQELQNGPPVGFPVQFRVSGDDVSVIRDLAEKVANKMRENKALVDVHFDWEEQSKIIKLEVDQDKARLLGVSSLELSNFLNASLNGVQATYFRERDKLVEVLIRGADNERASLHLLESLNVPTHTGKAVPLTQIAKVHYEFENGVIWRRDRLPTITVRADIYQENLQPATVTNEIDARLGEIRVSLPLGYRIDIGGAVEESAKGQDSIVAALPLFFAVVLTALMIQLMSFQRVLLVVLTAPPGMIGVVIALLLFNKPFGFVAMLGTIALFGMIMRNAVILIDQIEQDIAAGHVPYTAVVDATVRRFRPIVLTALASILGMTPLARSDFFGPMAVAIMGGLLVATVLTLLVLPAIYAAWFRVEAGVEAELGKL